MKHAKECRRILASGARCHALAVKDTPYCFFHQVVRDFHKENRSRANSILIPPLEDRASVQIAIMSVLNAMGSSKMDPARARSYFYGLQIAMLNIPKNGELAFRESIQNLVCSDEDGEFLAPEDVEVESSSEQILVSGIPCQMLPCTTEQNLEADSETPSAATESPSPAPQLPPEDDGPSNSEGTIDISAAADINAAVEERVAEEPAAIARYGAHPRDFTSPEPTERQLHVRKYLLGLIAHTLRAFHAAKPYLNSTERRHAREQLRSEYMGNLMVGKPEPLQCRAANRYLASRLQ